jgi:hypothetical protein
MHLWAKTPPSRLSPIILLHIGYTAEISETTNEIPLVRAKFLVGNRNSSNHRRNSSNHWWYRTEFLEPLMKFLVVKRNFLGTEKILRTTDEIPWVRTKFLEPRSEGRLTTTFLSCIFFFEKHSTNIDAHVHTHTLIPMNVLTYTLPLWVPSEDWAGGLNLENWQSYHRRLAVDGPRINISLLWDTQILNLGFELWWTGVEYTPRLFLPHRATYRGKLIPERDMQDIQVHTTCGTN